MNHLQQGESPWPVFIRALRPQRSHVGQSSGPGSRGAGTPPDVRSGNWRRALPVTPRVRQGSCVAYVLPVAPQSPRKSPLYPVHSGGVVFLYCSSHSGAIALLLAWHPEARAQAPAGDVGTSPAGSGTKRARCRYRSEGRRTDGQEAPGSGKKRDRTKHVRPTR